MLGYFLIALDGLGYVDDGREIFDDHDGDLEQSGSHKKSTRGYTEAKKCLNPDLRPSSSSPKCHSKDIRHMFAASASRQPKRAAGTVADDAALDDLLAELDADRPKDPPGKKPRMDGVRKSLSVKQTPKPSVVSHSRRETSYAISSQPLPPKPRQSHSSVNLDYVEIRSKDSRTLKVSPVKPSPVVGLEPEPESTLRAVDVSVVDDVTEAAKDEESTEVVSPDPEPPVNVPWLNEENENAEALRADENSSAGSSDGDSGSLRFFWLDAYEDLMNQQGVVFLFGKIPCKEDQSGFCSCCIRVKDLERRVFFLPSTSTGCTVKDVYEELRELSGQFKIGKFKCKPTTKKYCFEDVDVPSEAEYLEVRYPASYPSLPSDLKGKTFSRIMGSTASFLESLILDLHLRGPCWLELKGATLLQPQLSWCKVDYDFSFQQPNKMLKLIDVLVARSDNLALPPAPPIRMVALDVKSVARKQSNSAEIISVGLLIDNHFNLDKPGGKKAFQSHYLVLAPPRDSVLPYDLSKRLPTWGRQYQPPSSSGSGDDSDVPYGIDVEPNERALLGRLLTRIHRLDPDLLVGHDLWGNQLDLLVHRLVSHKVAHWHRIGRLRRSQHFVVNFNRSWFMRHALPGRLICDTRISARELVRSRTYNLSELAFQILGGDTKSQRQIPALIARQLASATASAGGVDEALISGIDLEVDSADLSCLFLSSTGVKELADFCLSDALLVLRLAHQLQVLPLAHQITSICGNVLGRTLAGGRSERNDALLLHAFVEQGYLPPEAPSRLHPSRERGRGVKDDLTEPLETEHEGRRKSTYTGGLVLDPKVGFYDTYILVLDFNSLYPSIIQEFNLCFSTMERSFFATKDPTDSNATATEDIYISELIASVTQSGGTKSLQQHLPTSRAPGILPSEVRRLVESRKEVKKLIATASAVADAANMAKVAQWNIRQQALKITANSVYGCLGFSASRFCARGLAALVTGLGRALLVNTKELVENMKLEVIYGDTDSIMVNTNSTDLLSALAIGDKVKQEVNRRYRLVELDIDGVFAAMLLLAKKKYAALAVSHPLQYVERLRKQQPSQQMLPPPPTKTEMKGLDIVRRDWCRLAVEVGKFCVTTLLSGRATSEVAVEEIHEHLRTVAQQVRDGSLPKTDFVITKMLTKNPEDYRDAKSQPHVQVALRFNQQTVSRGTGGGGGHRFRAGDTVEYIICNDGTSRSSVQRAYSPTELSTGMRPPKTSSGDGDRTSRVEHTNQEGRLTIDVHYYLTSQIHPVVSRLVAPIEGTSPAHIADCLGLDSASYRRSMAATAAAFAGDEETNDNGSMFSINSLIDVDPLVLACLACHEGKQCPGKALIRTSPFTQSGLAMWVCPECGEDLLGSARHAAAAVNQLVLQARAHIVAYEVGVLVCEDPTCALATRTTSCPPSTATSTSVSEGLWAFGAHQQQQPLCPLCGTGQSLLHPLHSEMQLYRQLLFYRHLLLPPESLLSPKLSIPPEDVALPSAIRDTLESGLRQVRRYLAQSAFAMVDLGQIFVGLRSTQPTTAAVTTAVG
ncbi:DNA polymerase alpha catalytic subunit [Echinococcus multilocularis]|uniref:DNA polymerase n=1 Tax=Echinococcus multilocularis TaxID=6211 RepID=A0A068Y5F2_ECHMU|nr:DNA polymerase alpha catalytic subunit [Echinococcus multilocularis]